MLGETNTVRYGDKRKYVYNHVDNYKSKGLTNDSRTD